MKLHPHAATRMRERGATEDEVVTALRDGEPFLAKYGRRGFRHHFLFDDLWRGRRYATKQVEAFAVEEDGDWLVISVIVKYF
ncbi:MAG TPA: hypothetical protein VHW66_23135 [Stellaceae bacterium]|jgi:hypothetical protein|nr:hypothetical protein [Stellaceae bacterium]